MTDYPFDMSIVVDPLNPFNVVADAPISIYDPLDEAGTTLLPLKDTLGLPLPNPINSNHLGFLQAFTAELPQVMWRSGSYSNYLNSYKGLRDEAVAAADSADDSEAAAEAAAAAAEATANGFTVGTVTTGSPAAASFTGTAPNRQLHLTIPAGEAGPIVPLDSLTDVTAPSPTNGQALTWETATSQWKPAALSLATLVDVNPTGVANGKVLTYDSATSKWIPADAGGGTWTGLTVTSPAAGQPLIYDATTSKWVNGTRATFSQTTGLLQLHANGNDQNALSVTINPAAGTYFGVAGSGYISRFNGLGVWFGAVGSSNSPGSPVIPSSGNHGFQLGMTGYNSGPGRMWHKAWGFSNTATADQSWATPNQTILSTTKTANYTFTPRDELTFFNSASALTATLPDPTAIWNIGRVYRVKNIGAGALSVVSAGTSKTIDGAATLSLAQWEAAEVTSDGIQWLIISRR